jgi:MFS family permease
VGWAPNAAALIAARVLFGVTGALVQPNGMSMMMHAFGPQRRATAMGWFQFATTGAPTIGLVVGGPAVDSVGWRALFFIFAGVAALAWVLGQAVLRETPRRAARLDYLGAATLGLAVLCALLAVSRLARHGVDAESAAMVAGVAVGVAGFIATERRALEPLLRLEYFRRRNFVAPLAASALNQFAYMGGFVVTPLLLGDIYGYAVGTVALAMVPRPGAFALSSPLGGFAASRLGERRPMAVASLLMIASMLCFAAGSHPGGLALVLAGLVASGLSAGIGAPSFNALAASAVDARDLGVANGMSQTMLFMGIVSGIQIMLVVLGETPDQGRFAATYLFGAVVAALGLAAGLTAQGRNRSAPAPAG